MNNDFGNIVNDVGTIINYGTINNNFLGSIDNTHSSVIDNMYGIINNTNKISNHCDSIIKNIHSEKMIGEPIISVSCIETPHPKDELHLLIWQITAKRN